MPILGNPRAHRHFNVLIRNHALATIGVAADYTSLELHPRYNDVGTWSLTFPESSRAASLLTVGTGVRITRAGGTDTVLSGPVRNLELSQSADRVTTEVKVSGPCDNTYLAERTAWPVPGAALNAQTDAYDVRTGVAETIMKGYVDDNAGPSAASGRPVTGLSIAADLGIGPTITGSARFYSLLVLMQDLAIAGGGIDFHVRQTGAALVFDVRAPIDHSATVRFSRRSGSLAEFAYSLAAPTVTNAIVAGTGVGAARIFVQRTNTTAETDWYARVESFVDQRDTTDLTELQKAGDDALTEGAPTTQLSFVPVDSPARQYGIDYGLGDLVTVELSPTISFTDIVREVAITDSTSDGLRIKPTVGSYGASDPSTTPLIYSALRKLGIALGLLQRRT
jgi:hypothetical protein